MYYIYSILRRQKKIKIVCTIFKSFKRFKNLFERFEKSFVRFLKNRLNDSKNSFVRFEKSFQRSIQKLCERYIFGTIFKCVSDLEKRLYDF